MEINECQSTQIIMALRGSKVKLRWSTPYNGVNVYNIYLTIKPRFKSFYLAIIKHIICDVSGF